MTLFKLISNNKDVKLIFGIGEIRIIRKQLLGVKLSQSEKNRLSRSIRPKLKFVRECSLYKDEFQVKKGGESLKQISILKDKILLDKKCNDVVKIFIFGSFVENRMSMDSDVDISVEFNNITEKEASLFKQRMSPPHLLDLSVFNFLSEKMKKEVICNGKIIFKTN